MFCQVCNKAPVQTVCTVQGRFLCIACTLEALPKELEKFNAPSPASDPAEELEKFRQAQEAFFYAAAAADMRAAYAFSGEVARAA